MGKELDHLPLTLGISTLTLISIYSLINKQSLETFTGGFGFEFPPSRYPIFTNMRTENLSTDFKLRDFVQRLKYKNFNQPQINNNPTPTEKKNPIILIPDLGESKIYKQDKDGSWVSMWSNTQNMGVVYDKSTRTLNNMDGVITTIKDFGSTPNYMNTLVVALQAIGYNHKLNLFGADYDFRKICSPKEAENYFNELRGMIEHSVVQNNGKKAIIMGHGLGANVSNYFLVNQSQQWKDKYIDSMFSLSGSFSGCPQALRTLLSGLTPIPGIKDLPKSVFKHYSGLLWLLPSSSVYNQIPLVYYNNVEYSINDIEQILLLNNDTETYEIYKNIIIPVQEKAMEAPGVCVYALAGYNIPTESDYSYNNSLSNQPSTVNPYYQSDQPYQNYENYPEKYNGDGIIPYASLEIPLRWGNEQTQPIHYRFYDRADHMSLLELYDPIKDIINIIKVK